MKNKLNTKFIFGFFAFVITLLVCASAYAYEIGQGYSCEGTTIFKNGKVISASKAKSAIQNKIDSIPKTVKNKTKIAALKDIKSYVANCAKGIAPLEAAGTWTGTLTQVSRSGSTETVSCEQDSTVTGSFVITGSGLSLSSLGSQNPFTPTITGKASSNGFVLSGKEGLLIIREVTLTATNATSSSATFTVLQIGKKFASRTRITEVCRVTYSGTFTRQ